MPAIHINNVDIQVYEQQYTSPTLHVQNTDGKIYHAIVIPDGGELFDASETLVYSNAPNEEPKNSKGLINYCEDVDLDAGMYRVELRGGGGGKQSRCNAGFGKINPVANTVSQIFKLPTQTTVYAFRGGDGNDSDAVTDHQIPGGGASGVDSMLIIDDRAIVGIGAPSSQCKNLLGKCYPFEGVGIGIYCQSIPSGTYSVEPIEIGNGHILGCLGCAGGGGGAPNGLGGAAASNTIMKATAGTNATSDGGGNGGDAENLMGDSQTKNRGTGGIGGKNVYWQCAGHTAVSYGGGGGGATCAQRVSSTSESYPDCADGGDGASGSTGKSDTSYVKIYKIG